MDYIANLDLDGLHIHRHALGPASQSNDLLTAALFAHDCILDFLDRSVTGPLQRPCKGDMEPVELVRAL